MTSSAIDFNVAGIEFIAAVLLAAAVFFWLPAALSASCSGPAATFSSFGS